MPIYDWESHGYWLSTSATTNAIFLPAEWTTSTTMNTFTVNNTYTYSTASAIMTNGWNGWHETSRRALAEVVDVEAARQQRRIARTSARDRATALLLSMLSAEQAESYRLTGQFEVIGSAGTLYRIERGSAGNIVWLQPDGSIGGRLCAHPEMRHGWMPDSDVAVAQLLALTTDEPAFVAMANVHAGRRPRILAGRR